MMTTREEKEEIVRKWRQMRESEKEWYDKLPEDNMSQKAFDSLHDYSCSLPTRTTVGKVWKKNLNFGYAPTLCGKPDPWWVICEYVEHKDPEKVGLNYRRPVIKD